MQGIDSLSIKRGAVNVAEVMAQHRDRQERLRAWRHRQDRSAEWAALKARWQAERRLRQARTAQQRQAAREALKQTLRMYRAELRRGWPKWNEIQIARRNWDNYRLPEGA